MSALAFNKSDYRDVCRILEMDHNLQVGKPPEMVARSTGGDCETIEEVETLSHFHVKFWMILLLQMNGRGKHICSRLISVLND